MRVAVLLTCHNRKQTTLTCLDALFACDLPEGVTLHTVLVDDASTDGTASAVAERFGQVEILHGDGNLFWNRGMHLAQDVAMRSAPDFVLWLNDDTIVGKDTLLRVLATYRQMSLHVGHPVIVVGATVDRATNRLTYAGLQPVSRLRQFQYRRVWNPDQAQECRAMNGNIVLIPGAIAKRVGNLDPVFEHAMGDIDYALRARLAGFRIFVAAGVAGYCSNNPRAGTHLDRRLPLKSRWQTFTSRKGLPPRSWLHFTRRHGGVIWPLYFFMPYLKFVARQLLPRVAR